MIGQTEYFEVMWSQPGVIYINKSKLVPYTKENALSRNEPCHCGSGKKLKHCHKS
jgi:uncharacterized protein YchJ